MDEEKKEPEDVETIHIFPVEGGLLILCDEEVNKPPVVESDPPKRPNDIGFYVWVCVCALLTLYIMLGAIFSSYLLPTVTITIIPESQKVSEEQTIQIVAKSPKQGQIEGQLFTRTLSGSKDIQASGRGHQNAAFAQGAITFYNGLLTPQSVPQGTILTGVDNVEVVTNETAFIPPAIPPVEGETTIAARAVSMGTAGNISARDINEACCGQGILAVNLTAFSGGVDARDFHFVTASDIASSSADLTRNLGTSFLQMLTAYTQKGDNTIPPICVFSTQSNHNVGDEVNSAVVTAQANCKSVLYSQYALQTQAETLLALKAKDLDSHYTSLNGVQVQVLSQVVSEKGNTIASVTAKTTGIWGYQFSKGEEDHMKNLVAGKTISEGLNLLLHIKGVEKAEISGVQNGESIPNDITHIQVTFLYFTI
ncbi:MAG: baseplate J/gp47 family protein [Ktedonobacteraceae bacterium]